MLGFELGCRAPFSVRAEDVHAAGCARSQNGEPAAEPWRLLLASDLHLTGRRRHLAERLAVAVEELQPDAVVLGGDLVDRRSGLQPLMLCLAQMQRLAPVVAIPGNHDRWCGLDAVRAAVVDHGGHWLPDGSVTLREGARRPVRFDASIVADGASGGDGACRVLVAHHPRRVQAAAEAGYDVVLAGHLHGGQCVLWRRGERLYPGAWLSRWNGPRFQVGGTTMLVSNGLADTLPLRFRCPREVVLCRLHVSA